MAGYQNELRDTWDDYMMKLHDYMIKKKNGKNLT